ncbi:hypothetical protein BU17DRAFT_70092 [Hysterangium stoloniferum]|nr:hypothetical protein BU17DRAFT_70092 [Hysterangium stoloniferum]
MSQYFRPPRPTISSTPTESQIQEFFHLRNHTDEELNNQMASSSTLIFPTAPSQRRSSSSVDTRLSLSDSTPSFPTDASIESLLSCNQRGEGPITRNGTQESWQAVSRTLLDARDRTWDAMMLEETFSLSESELDSGYIKPLFATRLTSSSPPGQSSSGIRSRTSSSLSSPFSRLLSVTPQLPFRLPFLSFLQSCLTLDESTLHLISRSPDPHNSVLFSVSPGVPPPLEDEAEPAHGVIRLLLFNPDKPKSTALLRASIDPSETPREANPLLLNPAQTAVWRLVELVIEGGVRVWKEVKAWDSGEARIVGL